MTTDYRPHRLDGLEPGNLLAFLALLGLLRAIEEAARAWLPMVAWFVDEPPPSFATLRRYAEATGTQFTVGLVQPDG